MVYKIHQVMRDVRVCVDENVTGDELLREGDVDTLALDDIIRSKIPDAVTRVHGVAPTHLLEEGHNFGDSLGWGDLESGWILLPDDFMRLVVFKMSDWERAVYHAISEEDPKYALQRQRIKALRGTAQKPVCAIVSRPEGRVLEFYSCKDHNAYVSQARYLSYPYVDESGGIDISEQCYTAVVYMAAALTMMTIGEHDKGSGLIELSKSALQ